MAETNFELHSTKKAIQDTAVGTAIGVGSGVGTVGGVALSTVGFTSSGIAAGSIAAGVQSAIVTVAGGSIFAGLQSFGAVGAGLLGTAVLPVAVVGGLVGGGIALFKHFTHKEGNQTLNSDEVEEKVTKKELQDVLENFEQKKKIIEGEDPKVEPLQIIKEIVEKACIATGISGLSVSVAVVASKLVIHLIGFTSQGVAANSIAAWIHSLIGVVTKGSLFAYLQSFGATSTGSILINLIVPAAVVGAVVGASYVIYKYRAEITELAIEATDKAKKKLTYVVKEVKKIIIGQDINKKSKL